MRLIVFLSIFLCTPAEADWFGPQSFEECVEDTTSAFTPKFAVNAIFAACRGDQWSSTVNECLIDSLDGVKVEYAARLINHACQGQVSDAVKSCLLESLDGVKVEYAARVIGHACQGGWSASENKCLLRAMNRAVSEQDAREIQSHCHI